MLKDLAEGTTEGDVKGFFDGYSVIKVKVHVAEAGPIAFVSFRDPDDVDRAVKAKGKLNGGYVTVHYNHTPRQGKKKVVTEFGFKWR